MQNKYFLNISHYKTHQQSITYKISISYFVRNFCLVHIYFFYFVFVVKGACILFIYFLVGQYLNILEEERQIYIYLRANLRLCLVTVFVFYFQKLVLGNIKKKQFSCIFEIKTCLDS